MERSTNPETDTQTQCEAAARRPISANSEFAWVESKNTQKGEPSVSLQNNTANNGSDSGNFSEAVSTPCPPTANSSPDSDLPFFSVGSPCLKLDRTSSTNVLSSSSSAVNQVSPRSLLQDKWSDLPFSSSPLSERVDRPELAMPRIKYTEDDFNGHQYSPEKHLRLLAENFQAFYQQKLREVEFEAGCGDRLEYAERREDVLKGWINDLVEQNRVLIETVDEMEQEAASRIYEMDKKVRHSTFAALQHMRIIQDYEERVQSFLAEKCEYEDTISAQRSKLAQIEFNGSKLEEKLQNLEAENEMLITLITRIRDWGVWDISDLRFGQRTYYRIFELYPHLAGSEVQTVFTIDRARKTEETEKQLENLRTKLRELQDFKCSAETELSEKNRLLSDFQTEREELRLALQKYASENDKYRKSLEETQRILVSRPAQPHKDKEMTDILQELQDLRNQLSLACAEKQNAIAESSSIKKEMHGRMVEFQQMQDLIATIQNDAKNTRSKVQDVQDRQDELKALREQVNVYRMKYDEARDMLNNKSDTIQNLQKQMDHLYEKVSKIENEQSRCSSTDLVSIWKQPNVKPPWNEYFTKDCSLDEHSEDPSIKKSETKKAPLAQKSLALVKEKRERRRIEVAKSDFIEKHKRFNSSILEQKKHSQEELSKFRSAKLENDNSDSGRTSTVSGNTAQCSGETIQSKPASEHLRKVVQHLSDRYGMLLESGKTTKPCKPRGSTVKLPPIKHGSYGDGITRTSESKKSRDETQADSRRPERLPRLVLNPRDEFKSEKPNIGRSRTLDALVTQAVRAGKQMVESFDPSKGSMKMHVRASHRHHVPGSRRVQETTFQTEGLTRARKLDETDLRVKTLFKVDDMKLKDFELIRDINKSPHSKTCPDLTKENAKGKPNKYTSLLASLPSDSQDGLVQKWIKTSISSLNLDDNEEDSYKSFVETEAESEQSEIRIHDASMFFCRTHNGRNIVTDENGNELDSADTKKADIDVIPSENGLPPVKDARETNFNENAAECDVQTYYTNHNGLLNNNTKLSPRLTNGQAFHVSAFENSHVQELQDRISLLESQCASKDTLLSSLHCELEAEKLDKQNWTRTMGSKDAEITMQKTGVGSKKDLYSAKSRQSDKISGPLRENLLRSYKEILTQEEELISIKSESEFLALRSELLEKNVLLYRSYVILGAVEFDYSHGDGDSVESYPEDPAYSECEDFFPRQIEKLKESQLENKELVRKLDLEFQSIRKLQKKLDLLAATKFTELAAMADELEDFTGILKNENEALNLEMAELNAKSVEPNTGGNLLNEIDKCLADLQEKDNQIMIRNQQIAQYDEYVRRLHSELQSLAQTPCVEDRIPYNLHLHPQFSPTYYLEEEKGQLPRGNQRQPEVASHLERIKDSLHTSSNRETELITENHLLRQTVCALSTKIEELVKSFEFLQFEEQPMQNHAPLLKSIAVPNDYRIPLITSTPLKQTIEACGTYENAIHEVSTKSSVLSPDMCTSRSSQMKGISYESLMNSIRDLHQTTNETRLHQGIEKVLEQIKEYVMQK